MVNKIQDYDSILLRFRITPIPVQGGKLES